MLPWQRFCQGALGQNFQFFITKWPFFALKVSISDFLVQIRNQRLKIDPCAEFQPNRTKDKGSSNFKSWNNAENCLMTSAKLLSILRDFVPEYHHAKFGGNWTTNKGKTEGGTMYPPAYIVPKYPVLNRVNPLKT